MIADTQRRIALKLKDHGLLTNDKIVQNITELSIINVLKGKKVEEFLSDIEVRWLNPESPISHDLVFNIAVKCYSGINVDRYVDAFMGYNEGRHLVVSPLGKDSILVEAI